MFFLPQSRSRESRLEVRQRRDGTQEMIRREKLVAVEVEHDQPDG
jgi:hypothetical protein